MRRDTPDQDLDRIVTTRELTGSEGQPGIIPLDRSTIWRMVRAGDFPAPIQLTASRIGWRWSAIKHWLDAREANPPKPRAYFGRQKRRAKRSKPAPVTP